jgi:hypothetical protein
VKPCRQKACQSKTSSWNLRQFYVAAKRVRQTHLTRTTALGFKKTGAPHDDHHCLKLRFESGSIQLAQIQEVCSSLKSQQHPRWSFVPNAQAKSKCCAQFMNRNLSDSEKIADLFDIKARYLRSVNLERDFADPRALQGYVPTDQVRATAHRLTLGLKQNTRSAIIEGLIQDGYVNRKNRELIATAKGISLITLLRQFGIDLLWLA